MTKVEAHNVLRDRGHGFLANVLFTRPSRTNTAALKKLAALVLKGHSVGVVSFTMPDERMYCCERTMTPAEVAAIDVDSMPDLSDVPDYRFAD